MRTMMRIPLLFGAITALTVPAALTCAQADAPAKAPNADAIAFYSAGLDAILIDPKDQSLLRALRMLDDRVLELPRETGDREMPAPAIKFALDLLMGGMDLRAGLLDEPPMDGPPFYAQLNFHTPDQQSAEALAGRFTGMLTAMAHLPPQMFQPAPDLPGMQMIAHDGPTAYFGAMKLEGGSAFTIALNRVDAKSFKPESIKGLPGKPVIALNLDYAALQPALEMMLTMQPPEQAEAMKAQLQAMGIYGPNAVTISAALAYTDDRAAFIARAPNARKTLQQFKGLPSQFLNANDLKRVPADATFAQISKYNLAGIIESLRQFAPAGEDPMAMVEQVTGVNPQRDVFDHLGQTFGLYASEATGGGGLMSLVALAEVKNAAGLNQTIARITAMINQIAQQQAKGYVRIAERTVNEQKMNVLSFPGVPIPLEISFTIADGYLYAAASPQSLLMAIAQGRSGKSGLGENPRFKQMGGDKLGDAMKVSFLDSPRLMSNGYGIVSLAMAALHNAVRSPTDPDRGADLLMPSLGELSNGAKAALTITRVEGDDVVVTSQFDRSWLVNATAAIGAMGGSTGTIASAALFTGIMMPALAKARDSAKDAKSMAQLRQIAIAIMAYAAESQERMPPDIQTLIDNGYLTENTLHSPLGSAPDGGEDYWIDFSITRLVDVKSPAERIIGYDRSMYARGRLVAVLFLDGHVEKMPVSEFDATTKNAIHKGVNFERPFVD